MHFCTRERCSNAIFVSTRVAFLSVLNSSDFVRYELLKIGICCVCVLPVCFHCVYLIPFVLFYCYTFLQNPELQHGG